MAYSATRTLEKSDTDAAWDAVGISIHFKGVQRGLQTFSSVNKH